MQMAQTHAVLKFGGELTRAQARIDELEAENARLPAQVEEMESKGAEPPVRTEEKDN